MIIYSDKGTQFDNDYKDLLESTQTVMTLMKSLLNKDYCLTIDSFNTYQQLTGLLIDNRTDCSGTEWQTDEGHAIRIS